MTALRRAMESRRAVAAWGSAGGGLSVRGGGFELRHAAASASGTRETNERERSVGIGKCRSAVGKSGRKIWAERARARQRPISTLETREGHAYSTQPCG